MSFLHQVLIHFKWQTLAFVSVNLLNQSFALTNVSPLASREYPPQRGNPKVPIKLGDRAYVLPLGGERVTSVQATAMQTQKCPMKPAIKLLIGFIY